MKTSQRIVRNTSFNTIGHFWSVFVSLLLVPYIISQIGIERYGLWVVIGVGLSYFSLFDIPAVGSAFSKYIAEYNTKKEYKKVNDIINLGFLYYFCFNLLLCVTIIVFKKPIINFFKFTPTLYPEAIFVLLGVMIVNLIRGPFIVFRSFLLGIQRMDLTNFITFFTSIPNILGTIFFLKAGYGLKGLVYTSIIVALTTVFFQVFFSYKSFPALRFNPVKINRNLLKECSFYGIKIQIARISEMINQGIDKVLLSHFIGTSATGFYELGAKVANLASSFPNLLLPAVMPAASELQALNENRKIVELYKRGTKYIALITVPITFFVIFNASGIIYLWIGKSGYESSVISLRILALAYNFYLLNGIGRLIARGIGVPKFEMKTCIMIAAMNILLSTILIIKIGFSGALIGTAVSMILGTVYFLSVFNKYLNISFLKIIKESYLLPLVSSISLIFIISLVEFKLGNFSLRMDTFYSLLMKSILFFSIYFLSLFKARYFDKYDRETLISLLKFVKNK